MMKPLVLADGSRIDVIAAWYPSTELERRHLRGLVAAYLLSTGAQRFTVRHA